MSYRKPLSDSWATGADAISREFQAKLDKAWKEGGGELKRPWDDNQVKLIYDQWTKQISLNQPRSSHPNQADLAKRLPMERQPLQRPRRREVKRRRRVRMNLRMREIQKRSPR